MGKYRDVLGQVLRLALIVAVCVAVMFGVYALLGRFDRKVLLGGLIGGRHCGGAFFVPLHHHRPCAGPRGGGQ